MFILLIFRWRIKDRRFLLFRCCLLAVLLRLWRLHPEKNLPNYFLTRTNGEAFQLFQSRFNYISLLFSAWWFFTSKDLISWKGFLLLTMTKMRGCLLFMEPLLTIWETSMSCFGAQHNTFIYFLLSLFADSARSFFHLHPTDDSVDFFVIKEIWKPKNLNSALKTAVKSINRKSVIMMSRLRYVYTLSAAPSYFFPSLVTAFIEKEVATPLMKMV